MKAFELNNAGAYLVIEGDYDSARTMFKRAIRALHEDVSSTTVKPSWDGKLVGHSL